MHYQLIFSQVLKYIPMMLNGLKISIFITIIGMFFGTIVGIFCAVIKSGHNKFLKSIVNIYTEIFRNTPLLLQMYLLFFGLAQFNIHVSAMASAIISLTLNTGAYTCVIFHPGIETVDIGQKEAAAALGMSKFQEKMKITIPQAFRIIFSPLVNQFISLFLFSAVAATISVPELLSTALLIDSKSMRTFEVFIITTILYLMVTTLITIISGYVEKRFKY